MFRSKTGPARVEKDNDRLREFVYLDDVSIQSLTASPDTPPPTRTTETSQSGRKGEASVRAKGSVPLIGNAEAGSKLALEATRSFQVERQFTSQSLFAQFFRNHSHKMRLKVTDEHPPKNHLVSSTDSADSEILRLEAMGRALRANTLLRGDLVEVNVVLSPDRSYELATFAREFVGLADNSPTLTAGMKAEDSFSIEEVGRVLDRLLVGLIPIRGEASELVTCVVGGELWIVNEADIVGGPLSLLDSVAGLTLVGVAESDLFWRDTRRLLHSNTSFDIVARVARKGLSSTWAPIKSLEVFDAVMPGAKQIFEGALAETMALGEQALLSTPTAGWSAPDRFQRSLVTLHGLTYDESSPHLGEAPAALEDQARALGEIARAFYDRHADLEVDPEKIAQLREAAMREEAETPEPRSSKTANDDEILLEVELIAIYW